MPGVVIGANHGFAAPILDDNVRVKAGMPIGYVGSPQAISAVSQIR